MVDTSRTDNDDIDVGDVHAEFICKKENKFKVDVVYLKLENSKTITKLMKQLNKYKLPIWLNDNKQYMLQCKLRHFHTNKELLMNDKITINLTLKYYDYEGQQGYYSVAHSVVSTPSDAESDPPVGGYPEQTITF